ncbi:MAG: UDP-N-acetylmuramoyl-L-alanyl-D-glutamate--2,6-diaminopimelate ligase [Desulfobacterota bacterium]|nr:UDP-N-acetylmuramoyl-L-alanyl-D-glutamate--2,6-diaminopimelate ligase [Thermodesulfobacteriota bacterium]MDW8001349.1 UDP-N-acetylmuramoyl-L-alanyl-D-glutamate--2,6-diaminopimelate ligase [Deltaproteobacteria bacterium]
MRLKDLLVELDIEEVIGSKDIWVNGISKDSRLVREGYLFFLTKKNAPYLGEAIASGAKVIITDMDGYVNVPCFVRVKNVERSIGEIASRFFKEPTKNMFVLGITGTNGKTTTAFLIDHVLSSDSIKTGLIGTVFHRYGNRIFKSENTTPGAIELQTIFNEMRKAEITHVVMEVSSHALDQKRVEGVHFDVCVFTNISHDHLDYHGSFSNYREAKALLFNYYLKRSLKPRKIAILNGDDPNVSYFITGNGIETYFFGLKRGTHTQVLRYEQTLEGIEAEITVLKEKLKVSSNLIGKFNLYNILAASLALKVIGIERTKIERGLEAFQGVPGRLERIKNSKGYKIFVDYAHTPHALKEVLETLSELKKGRLIVVFGCGGDRDKEKRPIMGRIATTIADFSIITSDNPRSEDPLLIIEEIRKGAIKDNYKIIVDRKEAIYEAVKLMNPEDVLLVAGKGHEDYQIVGDKVLHFSDREVIEEALRVVL